MRGYLPLTGIVALSEFVPIFYVHDLTFISALCNAIAMGGGMFASLYGARIFLDVVLSRYVDRKINKTKTANVALYMLGLDCIYLIFANLLPGTLTFLLFLPLLSVMVLFKGTAYMCVGEDRAMNFLLLAFTGVVILPAIICWLLTLII